MADEFPQGPISKVDDQRLTKQLESFNRLANNVYSQKYPRQFSAATATGILEKEALAFGVSNEGIEKYNVSIASESRLEKLKSKIRKSES